MVPNASSMVLSSLSQSQLYLYHHLHAHDFHISNSTLIFKLKLNTICRIFQPSWNYTCNIDSKCSLLPIKSLMPLLNGPHLVLGSKPCSDIEHSPRLMVSAKILPVSSRASTHKPGKKIHFLIFLLSFCLIIPSLRQKIPHAMSAGTEKGPQGS